MDGSRLFDAAAPLVLAVALVAATFVLVAETPPLYEASVRLQAAPVPLLRDFAAAVQGLPAASAKADDPLQARDLPELGLAELGARSAIGGPVAAAATFSVKVDGDRRELEIAARAGEARASEMLANAFAQTLIIRRNTVLEQRASALEDLLLLLRPLAELDRTARTRITVVRAQLRRLELFRQFSGGGVTVIAPAKVPRERVAPRTERDMLVAGVLGLLIGFTPAVAGSSWSRILRRARSRVTEHSDRTRAGEDRNQ